MEKIQVQLPSPTLKRLRQVSEVLDVSIAELLRRGADYILNCYKIPKDSAEEEWEFPLLKGNKLKISDPRILRELANRRDQVC